MPRKKVAKTAKTTKKVNSKSRPKAIALSAVDLMEKEFSALPEKMSTQSRKDLASLKQQEKKLKSELKKAQAQKKIAKNKRVTLTAKSKSSKSTAASKKLLTAAKQAYDKISDAVTDVSNRYDAVKKQAKELATKQARFAALAKIIAQFEKECAIKAKKSAAAAKPKKKTKKSKGSNTSTHNVSAPKTLVEAPIAIQTEEAVEA